MSWLLLWKHAYNFVDFKDQFCHQLAANIGPRAYDLYDSDKIVSCICAWIVVILSDFIEMHI